MPSKQELLQEIANRGLQDQLPPQKRVIFDEAVRRGLVQMQQPGGGQLQQQTPEPQNLQAAPGIQQQTTQPGAPAQPAQAPGDILGPQLQTASQDRPSFAQPQAPALEALERQKQQLPTRAAKELNEFVTHELGLGFTTKLAVAMGTGASDEEIEDILRKHPRVALQQDEGGNTIVNILDKQGDKVIQRGLLNKKGIDLRDVFRAGAVINLFVPAAKAATGGATLAAKALQGGLAASATSVGSDIVRQGLGSEKTGEDSARDATIAGTFGFAGEAAVPSINQFVSKGLNKYRRFRTRKTAEFLDAAEARSQQAKIASAQTGIDLLEPQATKLPSDLVKMKTLLDIPDSSIPIIQFLERQDKQIASAVKRFLGDIAPEKSLEAAAARVRASAKTVIETARADRQKLVKPLYDKAFADRPKVDNADMEKIMEYINSRLEVHNDGFTRKALLAAKNRLINVSKSEGPAKKELIDLTTKSPSDARRLIGVNADEPVKRSQPIETRTKVLHEAQQEIADIIEGKVKISDKQGGGGLHGRAAEEVKAIRDQLMGVLRKDKSYDAATEAFKKASPGVEKLQQGNIGRLANIKDIDLERLSSKLFDPGTSSPEAIRRTKQLLTKYDPKAWDAIVRSHLEKKLATAFDEFAIGSKTEVSNIPTKFLQSLTSGKDGRLLRVAMDPRQARNYAFLVKVLSHAKQGRGVGSQTAIKQEFIKDVRHSVGVSYWNLLFDPLKIWHRVGERATGSLFNRKMSALSEAMVNDKWSSEIAKISRRDFKSPDVAKALGQLLLRIENDQSGQ